MASTPAAAATSQTVTLPFVEELFNPNFLDVLLPATRNPVSVSSVVDTPQNPMMDALKSTASHTLTWNDAPAFSSTGSATLDAFQHLTRYASWDTIDSALTKAWKEDPTITLRLIWNTRSIHDGKGEKELFYQAYAWLYKNHPRTAIANLAYLVAPVCKRKGKKSRDYEGLCHGYWKDLLNILGLATFDELGSLETPSSAKFLHWPRTPASNSIFRRKRNSQIAKTEGRAKDEVERASRIEAALRHNAQKKEEARNKRSQARAESYERLARKLQDVKYRALYVAVARLIADKLAEDLVTLEKLDSLPQDAERQERFDLLRQLSLVGKWAPTPGGVHDRHTNIATAVCLLLHRAGHVDVSGIRDPLSRLSRLPLSGWSTLETHIVRSFYQRWVLRPLRSALACPEPLMSANRWNEIRYNRVPSICMKNNTEHFCRHDLEGFGRYLMDVESGKRSISGATLMPHELVKEVLDLGNYSYHVSDSKKPSIEDVKKQIAEMKLRVFEEQWKTLIARLREAGTLESVLAVCDVSGSMFSPYSSGSYSDKKTVQPIYPALSLSLILAQLGKPPFNNGFITFSSNPQFVQVNPEEDGLAVTLQNMQAADWGMNTNLHSVFVDLLLPLAVKNAVKPEDMIKRLFIFSDMQFDEAEQTSRDAANWQTNHDAIETVYREAGYEVPQIVYWNLNAGFVSVPVESERKGVALMTGFSPAMLKVFMGEEGEESLSEWATVEQTQAGEVKTKPEEEFNPINVMKKVLGRESYNGLVVVD
ncbi:hypothetical protein NEOLEDRAFT_1176895 [Neolentinus lepideus HHB14362 ss-1]|uniref:Uncharacterized protein n=1 Tax=Neolentinus lepideus HHB14362 ss-1 TaxID=1314782 RepID=A0A165TS82_9AGAM|nr:hypothetical protein NEOLEDRAFT_1176895 [Neolentinus lepideus HHB14362 ss-1]